MKIRLRAGRFIGSALVRMAIRGNRFHVVNLDKTYAGNLEI
jgi:dTDP-D-glucose 4,6-dehydratase